MVVVVVGGGPGVVMVLLAVVVGVEPANTPNAKQYKYPYRLYTAASENKEQTAGLSKYRIM